MSVRCAVCSERLSLVSVDSAESLEFGRICVESWRCCECRSGGHRCLDRETDRVVNVAGPALDYAPEVSDR